MNGDQPGNELENGNTARHGQRGRSSSEGASNDTMREQKRQQRQQLRPIATDGPSLTHLELQSRFEDKPTWNFEWFAPKSGLQYYRG